MTNSAPFDARAAALNSVMSAWLRSMKARRGLQFRTATNSGHAEIALKTSLPVIITASTTACDRLGGEADSLIQEMTTAMLENDSCPSKRDTGWRQTWPCKAC